MNLSKKIISLSLVASLFVQGLSADILNNALSNVTPASSHKIKDSKGNTVKSMYYTGGLSFKFNRGATNEPLWNFSPPQIEAGCDGINIKGMFISILSLDQFAEQLQEAGVALAWGVAVGLIYSLPGVFNVFKTLNQWAKKIQELIASACSQGIAMGQALGESAWALTGTTQADFQKKIDSATSPEALGSSLQEGLGKTARALGFNWDKGFSGTEEISKEDKTEALSLTLKDVFVNVSIGGYFLDDIRKKGSRALNKKIEKHIDSKIKGILNHTFIEYFYSSTSESESTDSDNTLTFNINDMVSGLQNISTKSTLGLQMIGYALFANTVGDFGFRENEINRSLAEMAKVLERVEKENQTKADEDKVVKQSAQGTSNYAKASTLDISLNDTILKDFLLKGSSAEDIDVTSIKAPRFVVIGGYKSTGKALNKDYIISATSLSKKPFFSSKEEFLGIKTMSTCMVHNTFNKIENLKGDKKSKLFQEADVKDCNKIPELYSEELLQYADLLSKVRNDERINFFLKYKNTMIYKIANSLLAGIKNISFGTNSFRNITASDEETKIDDTSSGATAQQESSVDTLGRLTAFTKVIENIEKNLLKELGIDAKDLSLSTFEADIGILEEKVKTRTLEMKGD